MCRDCNCSIPASPPENDHAPKHGQSHPPEQRTLVVHEQAI